MGTTKSARNNALFLLGSLIRSLSHELRSPLSVLANDLTYLKSRYPNDDVDRALAQVDKISSLLKKVSKIGDGALDLESHPMKEVLALAELDTAQCGDAMITVDRDVTALALQWLVELLDGFSYGKNTAARIAPGQIEFSQVNAPSIKGDFSSLTSFCSEACRTNTLLAPLIDSVFQAQAIELKISSGDRLVVNLGFH